MASATVRVRQNTGSDSVAVADCVSVFMSRQTLLVSRAGAKRRFQTVVALGVSPVCRLHDSHGRDARATTLETHWPQLQTGIQLPGTTRVLNESGDPRSPDYYGWTLFSPDAERIVTPHVRDIDWSELYNQHFECRDRDDRDKSEDEGYKRRVSRQDSNSALAAEHALFEVDGPSWS